MYDSSERRLASANYCLLAKGTGMTATRPLGLGKSSAFGDRGITKRLDALGRHAELKGHRLLDIGCGDGAYTRILADDFDLIDAVDIQLDRLEAFRQNIAGTPMDKKITVRDMSAEKLDYPTASFDVITAIEVLEHVGDLGASLREVSRVLKPGGTFAVTTPNRWFPFETHGFLVRGRRYKPTRGPFLPWIVPLHRRLADARSFTARGLSRQLNEAGLRPTAIDYIMPPFDRSRIGQRISPVTDFVERSPLKFFGMALVVLCTKTVAE